MPSKQDVSNESKQILLTNEEVENNEHEQSSLSDSESEGESDDESDDESEVVEVHTKKVDLIEEETNYEKMTAKELKEIITDRGVNVKKYMKKQEMIDMLTNMDKQEEVYVVKEDINEDESVVLEQKEDGFDLSLTNQEEGVEDLWDLTSSCVRTHPACGECWWCKEREWARG